MIKRLLLPSALAAAWLSSCLFVAPARAQLMSAETVSACGTANHSPPSGIPAPFTQDPNGHLCTNATGGGGGGSSSSNASDAVATSATNGQVLSWLYGFNGATWDRLRDDTNKYLYVDSIAASGAFADCAITTIGCEADPAWVGTGSGSIVAILKGLAINQAGPTVLGPSASVSIGITSVPSTAAETAHVLKAAPGNLYSVYVTTGATAGFLLVLNSTTDPGNGAVTPKQCIVAPANATTGLDFGPGLPGVYSTGITAVFSTTGCFTETQSATAFFSGRVQ